MRKQTATAVGGAEEALTTLPDKNPSPAHKSELSARKSWGTDGQSEGDGRHTSGAGAVKTQGKRPHRKPAESNPGLVSKKSKLRLSPRQSKFLEEVLAGKNQYQAAVSAGYSKSFSQNPAALMKGRALQEAFGELMPSIERLAQGICEGISAERIEFIKLQGSITDKRSHIDWEQRRKYIELASRLRGLLSQPKVNVEMNGDIQVVIEHIGGK